MAELTQDEIKKLKKMLKEQHVKKLTDILTKEQLAKLKKNMQEFVKKEPTGWAHSMHIASIKNLLEDFDSLTEKDLGHLDGFWGKPKPKLPRHPPFNL